MSIVKTPSGKISQFTLKNINKIQLELEEIKAQQSQIKKRRELIEEALSGYSIELINEIEMGTKISEGSLNAYVDVLEKKQRASWKTEFIRVAGVDEAQKVMDSVSVDKIKVIRIVGS